jgi:hypothetical protein
MGLGGGVGFRGCGNGESSRVDCCTVSGMSSGIGVISLFLFKRNFEELVFEEKGFGDSERGMNGEGSRHLGVSGGSTAELLGVADSN